MNKGVTSNGEGTQEWEKYKLFWLRETRLMGSGGSGSLDGTDGYMKEGVGIKVKHEHLIRMIQNIKTQNYWL